ncbi:enoyl-CoA hydratase [Actinomycetes bacterium M1A6_2h]
MSVGITRDGHVLTVELQREDRRNALNTSLCTDIRDAIEGAEADGVRVVVLTGRGSSFCAGADLSGDDFSAEFPAALIGLMRAVSAAPMPVIAAINGPAVGAGVQLAIASDLRVVAPDAFLAIPVTKLGIAVDNWTVRRLTEVAGGGVARTILMGADRVGAEQAFACGLANKIGGLDVAREWATAIGDLAPLTLRHLKLVFNDDGSLDPPNDIQHAAYEAAWGSRDAVEARNARAEKRPAVFTGN